MSPSPVSAFRSPKLQFFRTMSPEAGIHVGVAGLHALQDQVAHPGVGVEGGALEVADVYIAKTRGEARLAHRR